MALTSPPGTIRWIEPVESLDPGDRILGGVTSTHLSRGRVVGYGIYLTTKRIIGVKRKRIALVVYATGLGSIIPYFFATFYFHLDPLLAGIVPLFFSVLDLADKRVTTWVGERILAKADTNIPQQLGKKRDFEVERGDIDRLEITRISDKKQTFDIILNDYRRKPVTIKLNRIEHYSRLRNLLEEFSQLPPAVRLREI